MKQFIGFILGLFILVSSFAQTRIIAISYFDNTSNDQKYRSLSKGIADMLITDLSKVPDLTIVERARLEDLTKEINLNNTKYFDQQTAQKLGKGLGADEILTGAYLILDNNIRIDARMIEVESGTVIFSEEVTGAKNNFFTLHNQLVNLLNRNLKLTENKPVTQYAVTLDIVMDYSTALDFQDDGLDYDAKVLLEQTVAANPDFIYAKDKLSEIRAFLEKMDELRYEQTKQQYNNFIRSIDPTDKELGSKFMAIWQDLFSYGKCPDLLAFNQNVRNYIQDRTIQLTIDDLQDDNSFKPLTLSLDELLVYYDCKTYLELRKYDELIQHSKTFLEHNPSSVYYDKVRALLDKGLDELETREEGKDLVAEDIRRAEYFNVYGDLFWDIRFKNYQPYTTIAEYNTLKDYFKTHIIGNLDIEDSGARQIKRIADFVPFVEVYNDSMFMNEMLAEARKHIEKIEDEETYYKLESTLDKVLLKHEQSAMRKATMASAMKSGKTKKMDVYLDSTHISSMYYAREYPFLLSYLDPYLSEKLAKTDKASVEKRYYIWDLVFRTLNYIPTDSLLFESYLKKFKSDIVLKEVNTDQHFEKGKSYRFNYLKSKKGYQKFQNLMNENEIALVSLKKQGEIYQNRHQYIDEIRVRKEMLRYSEISDREKYYQEYAILRAYSKLGYFRKARRDAEELLARDPDHGYKSHIKNLTSRFPE